MCVQFQQRVLISSFLNYTTRLNDNNEYLCSFFNNIFLFVLTRNHTQLYREAV